MALTTRRFLPGMVEYGRRRVLNVASTAAFMRGQAGCVLRGQGVRPEFSEAVNERKCRKRA